MTKEQLISDIILRITKGKPADDLELERSQVEFWINIVLDEMVKNYLDEKALSFQQLPNFFIVREACKAIEQEDLDCIDDLYDRMYVMLSKPVYEVVGDKGVVRVKTSDNSTIRKSSLSTIDFISNIEFAKPSLNNLVYYRDGLQKLIINGIPVQMKDVIEIIVWYVPRPDLECFADDEELPIQPDMVAELQDRVEDIARRQMFGFGDVTNDGFDDLPNAMTNG